MDRYLIASVSMAVSMPIFTKHSPARNFFPQKTPVPNIEKFPTYGLFSNIGQRRTDKRKQSERLTDVFSTNMFLFYVREKYLKRLFKCASVQ